MTIGIEELAPLPRTVLVLDEDDGPELAAHLEKIGNLEHGRVLVRPTPGCHSVPAFALDLLTALGKNPLVLARDWRDRDIWNTARAWLAAYRPHDVLIDRAHRLPPDVLAAAASAALETGASAWLIWSGPQDPEPATRALAAAGSRADTRHAHRFIRDLPAPPWHTPAPPQHPTPVRPVLPTADFPLFLSVARRQLAGKAFDALLKIYRDAQYHTRVFLAAHPPQPGGFEAGPVAWWLRDTQIGPCTTPYKALVTLRATQAALARVGILLIWDRTELGPRPHERLPGALTPGLCRALSALARTEDTLAAALALHLEQDAACFGCWNIADADINGRVLRPAGTHRHRDPKTRRIPAAPRDQLDYATTMLEIPCRHPITLPHLAARFLRAHLACRSIDGARPGDPLFAPETAVTPRLNTAIRRAARHVGHDPWWLDPVRVRARHLGPRLVHSSWMTERGLSLRAHADLTPGAVGNGRGQQ